MKFNGDATVGQNKDFEAMGILCCDHEGKFLGASSIKFRDSGFDSSGSSSGTESLAPAENLYVQKIQVASHCKIVVSDILRGTSEYGAIRKEVVLLV